MPGSARRPALLPFQHFHFETHSNLLYESTSLFGLDWFLLNCILLGKEILGFSFNFAVDPRFVMSKLEGSELVLLLF